MERQIELDNASNPNLKELEKIETAICIEFGPSRISQSTRAKTLARNYANAKVKIILQNVDPKNINESQISEEGINEVDLLSHALYLSEPESDYWLPFYSYFLSMREELAAQAKIGGPDSEQAKLMSDAFNNLAASI